MSIEDINNAAAAQNALTARINGFMDDVDARIAVKEGEVDTFLDTADATFEKLQMSTNAVAVLGDADKYYPVAFDAAPAINQLVIRRNVSEDSATYGSFNGSLLLDAIYQQTADGVYAGALGVRWHTSHSYSPDLTPATTQFVARMTLRRAIRALPADTEYPCIWLRGNTTYNIGVLHGDIHKCAGDGIVLGRDYGILPDTYSPLMPFTS